VTGQASVFSCSNSKACQRNGDCGAFRKPAASNPLCAACIDDYQESGGECILCDVLNGGMLVLYIAFSFLIVFLLHLINRGPSRKSGRFAIAFLHSNVRFICSSNFNRW